VCSAFLRCIFSRFLGNSLTLQQHVKNEKMSRRACWFFGLAGGGVDMGAVFTFSDRVAW
jgi:hypothetical protein